MDDANLVDVWAVAIKPSDSRMMLVGTRGYKSPGKGGIYRTTDGSAPFERVDLPDIVIPYQQDKRSCEGLRYTRDGSYLVAVFNDNTWDANNQKGAYYSTDDGQSWREIGGLGIKDGIVVRADPFRTNRVYLGTEGGGAVRVDF